MSPSKQGFKQDWYPSVAKSNDTKSDESTPFEFYPRQQPEKSSKITEAVACLFSPVQETSDVFESPFSLSEGLTSKSFILGQLLTALSTSSEKAYRKWEVDGSTGEIEFEQRVRVKHPKLLNRIVGSDLALKEVLVGLPAKIDSYLKKDLKLAEMEISVDQTSSEIVCRLAIIATDSLETNVWDFRIQNPNVLEDFDSKYWIETWSDLSTSITVTVW